MAICLSRNFRSCSSFAFVGRRNQHSNSLDIKSTNSVSPLLLKEVPFFTFGDFEAFLPFLFAPCPESNHCIKPYSMMSFCDHSFMMLPKGYESNSKSAPNLQLFFGNVLCAQECKAYKKVQKDADENLKRADKAQLEYVANVLIEDLPQLFNRNMNYKIYHPNMSFENNIRGTKTVGVFNYMREMFILKMIGNIRFSNVKFTILKLTDHPEDGTIRVRWRIVGVSQLKNILRMIKQMSQKNVEPEGWYDGFSIFYVRSDGLIHRHIVDKMIPDSSDEEKLTSLRNHLAAKMAFAVGVSVKQSSVEEMQNKSPCLSKVTYSLEIHKPSLKVKFSDTSLQNNFNGQN